MNKAGNEELLSGRREERNKNMKCRKSLLTILLTVSLAIFGMTVFAEESTSAEIEEFVSMESETENAVWEGGDEEETEEQVLADIEVADSIIASGKSGNITWVIDSSGKLTVEGTGDLNGFKWGAYREQIKSAEINISGMTNASYLFFGCSSLTSVDISGFDTSNVTDMCCMFYDCSSLTSLDVSGFDTSKVTDMSGMFSDCVSLTSLDVSGFDTSNVTDMSAMFQSCRGLLSLDVSGFDTSNVTDMRYMFNECSSLTCLDVSGFDTGNVMDMGGMFVYCRSLADVDVSGFDTGNVTSMYGMFWDCCSLTSVDISGFDTSNVTDMSYMFDGCSSLSSVDVGGVNTRNVTNMYAMFGSCSSLVSVDLSSLDLSGVEIVELPNGTKRSGAADMFSGCDELTTIKTFKAVPKEAICNLPTYYVDESGSRTNEITAAFVGKTLTREGANSPTPTPTPVNPPSGETIQKVQNFVSRMYTVALGREAEEAGLNDWTNRLLTHEIDGAGIANGFIMSDEFKNRNLSNEDFVDTLYRTFFDREADQGGRATWLAELAAGKSRSYVLAGFVNSTEFDNLCDAYGIARGSMREDGSPVNAGIQQFVERCYTKVLGREGEKAGVEDWTNRIATAQMSAEDVAKSFFFSEEYTNKNTDNENFVETLYQTFMDRASDPAGKNDWVGRLGTGTDREDVLEGFSRSEEFAGILRSYGL